MHSISAEPSAARCFGEALVFLQAGTGAGFCLYPQTAGRLAAKGRLLGVQFDALMENGVYEKVGAYENEMADRLREVFARRAIRSTAKQRPISSSQCCRTR